MATAKRNTRARRKKSSFRKQNGSNPYAGRMNNMCPCHDCRDQRFLF